MDIFETIGIKPEEYFLTGSRALDTDSFKISIDDTSDYDYVTLIFNRHKILNYLNSNNIQVESSNYNGGFKFLFDGKLINVITLITVEFMAWREALDILKLLIAKDIKYQNAVKNKFSRYCLYEQLRGLIKTALRLGEINA